MITDQDAKKLRAIGFIDKTIRDLLRRRYVIRCDNPSFYPPKFYIAVFPKEPYTWKHMPGWVYDLLLWLSWIRPVPDYRPAKNMNWATRFYYWQAWYYTTYFNKGPRPYKVRFVVEKRTADDLIPIAVGLLLNAKVTAEQVPALRPFVNAINAMIRARDTEPP